MFDVLLLASKIELGSGVLAVAAELGALGRAMAGLVGPAELAELAEEPPALAALLVWAAT